GVLLAFFHNVWCYGGGAVSDVPSMALIVIACALLFAGCRNSSAYLAGTTMLAISAGFRPQNLLVGFAPFVVATIFQFRKSVGRVLTAGGLLVAIVAISYLRPAFLTGWSEDRPALRIHQVSIPGVRSFLS